MLKRRNKNQKRGTLEDDEDEEEEKGELEERNGCDKKEKE